MIVDVSLYISISLPAGIYHKKKKTIFEGLIADSCKIERGPLSINAESVALTIRKKSRTDLCVITARIHVFCDLAL